MSFNLRIRFPSTQDSGKGKTLHQTESQRAWHISKNKLMKFEWNWSWPHGWKLGDLVNGSKLVQVEMDHL